MTSDTEFYAGGLAMQFTAAAILLLAQQEKLKLDDPLSKYVPEFKLGCERHHRAAAHANFGPARVHGRFPAEQSIRPRR